MSKVEIFDKFILLTILVLVGPIVTEVVEESYDGYLDGFNISDFIESSETVDRIQTSLM